MRRLSFTVFSVILLLTACNHPRNPDKAEMKKVINLYLQTHGKDCTWIGQPFPVNVSESQQGLDFGIASKMAVLEHSGLVRSTETMNTVPGMFGGSTQRHVKRYRPTAIGTQYLQTVQTSFGQSAGFCYGTKQVDSIVKWTEPATTGEPLQTEVIYTYKISNLASWAQRADVQNQFITGISKTDQRVGLELTNKGWEVPLSRHQ